MRISIRRFGSASTRRTTRALRASIWLLTHLAIDVYPNDAPIPPGEEWFYELDGRVHGPLSRADLDELLNGSGETALQVRVRHRTDGPWRPFRTASVAPASFPMSQQNLGGDFPARSAAALTVYGEWWSGPTAPLELGFVYRPGCLAVVERALSLLVSGPVLPRAELLANASSNQRRGPGTAG